MTEWIEWSGGACPVTGPVFIKCRDGIQFPCYWPHTIDWTHAEPRVPFGASDIVAYKVPNE